MSYGTREFVSIISLDEEVAEEYCEVNGCKYTEPGDFISQEFASKLADSGVSLSDWAITDSGVLWEEYLLYLVSWAIEYNSDEYEGMSPLCYAEWKTNRG